MKELNIGFANTYTAEFIGADGNAVYEISPVWTITDCSFASSIEQTVTGDSVKLLVDSNSLLDETFTLNVSDADNRFTQSSLTITIKGIY